MDIEIRTLNEEETYTIYCQHLKKDFPKAETKPFPILRKGIRKGYYDAYGAYMCGELVGYAFFVKAVRDGQIYALLDYFAVVKEKRNSGIGTEILKKLTPEKLHFGFIIIESESFTEADEEEVRRQRARRIRFYERLGAVRTELTGRVNGVDYEILLLESGDYSMKADKEKTAELICSVYMEFYDFLWFPTPPSSVCRIEKNKGVVRKD